MLTATCFIVLLAWACGLPRSSQTTQLWQADKQPDAAYRTVSSRSDSSFWAALMRQKTQAAAGNKPVTLAEGEYKDESFWTMVAGLEALPPFPPLLPPSPPPLPPEETDLGFAATIGALSGALVGVMCLFCFCSVRSGGCLEHALDGK